MVRIPVLFAICLVAACARPPEIDAALGPEPEGNDYPEIVPFAEILEADDADFDALAEDNASLEERVEALRARAAALRALSPQR